MMALIHEKKSSNQKKNISLNVKTMLNLIYSFSSKVVVKTQTKPWLQRSCNLTKQRKICKCCEDSGHHHLISSLPSQQKSQLSH